MLVVDDGFVCGLVLGKDGEDYLLVVFDVIVRIRREFLEWFIVCDFDDDFFIIVIVVDVSFCSYKVFVFNSCELEEMGMYVYEFCINEWCVLKNFFEVLGVRNVVLVVVLYGILYVIFC